MKTIWKSIIVVLVALFAAGQANAQFRFGIKAGLNLNSLHLDNVKHNFDEDNGCGFTGGVMTEFTVPLVGLCFDASLMYTHMSASTGIIANDGAALSDAHEITPKKDFLEIPVNIKYRFGMVPVVKPYIFTGPSFAFKFGGDDDVLKTKTFQCAWNIGLGLEVFNHVQIGASYGFGMNNTLKKFSDDITVSNDIKLKNNYWTITAAYLF